MDAYEHYNRPFPTSPSLVALSYLEPPSPIIYPSDPLSVSTSGEIPIFFDSGSLPLPFSENDDEIDISTRSDACIYSQLPTNRRSSVPTLDTIGSIGTFGPTKGHVDHDFGTRFSHLSYKTRSDDNIHCVSFRGPSRGADRPVLEAVDTSGQDVYTGHPIACTESWISELAFPVQLERPTSTSSSTSAYSRNGPLTEQEFLDILAAYDNTYTTSHLAPKGDLPQQIIRDLPPEIQNPEYPSRVMLDSSCDQIPTSKSPSTFSQGPISCDTPLSAHAVPVWLREAIIELHIDQEGFRSIQPTFLFAECSKGGSIVVFMPSKEEAFNFHHGPFDSSPVLHRLVVNGRESMDYISRQASLCLKTNGVYTVRGTESPCSTHRTGHGGVLFWKFDYLVGDRKLSSGRVVDGEKTLTPLRFSCSPLLLHPLQGKRVRFIHIVKKNVTAKLIAEKVETFPGFTPSRGFSLSPQTNHLKGVWPLHRRVKSHTHAKVPPHQQPSDATRTTQVDPTIQEENVPQYHTKARNHRRRASSAGEWNRSESRSLQAGPGTERPDRHILSPLSLTKLLEECDKERDIESLCGGLSPAPRTRKHHHREGR